MIIDNGGRGSGKSTRAVDWAADNDMRTIVSPYQVSVDYLKQIAAERGVKIRVISWKQYLNGALRGYRDMEVYIDELGICLDSLGGHIAGVSGL